MAALLLATSPAAAQEPVESEAADPTGFAAGAGEDGPRPQQPPGQTLPLTPTRTIAFDTDEGSWMSLDVSPDGRRIVFDLLGDLYAMDVDGGRAEAIARGMAVETQPTFSPNGRSIAYVSDRSGAENLWIARADGAQARQVSFGDDDSVLVSPAWSADGKSLFVSRHRYSIDSFELWRHDLDTGAATIVVPVRASPSDPRTGWKSSLGAVASPDGRHLWFARRTGTEFEGVPEWTIVRRDLSDGAEAVIVAEPDAAGKARNPGASFRPTLSPDGRLLAYATRLDGKTELRIRDLKSGADRRLAFPIEHDQLEAQPWQDLVPRFDFTPDGGSIILTRNGGFERIDVASGKATPIAFSARVDLDLGPLTRVSIAQETGPVRARIIQTPEQSPDGRHLVFSALGRVYLMALDGKSAPRPLVHAGEPQFHPSWSPDGDRIAFVTWSAESGGHVWVVPAGGGEPKRLTGTAAYYTSPTFTPDGSTILALRSDNRDRLHSYMEWGKVRQATLVAIPAAGGPARDVATGSFGGKPHFSGTADRVFLQVPRGLGAVDLKSGATGDPVTILGPGWYFQDGPVPVDDSRISPDGQWILAQVAQQLHLVEAPPPGSGPLNLSSPGVRHRRVTAGGADFFEWAGGGKAITWSVGSTFYRRPLDSVALSPPDALSWTADDPDGDQAAAFEAVIELPRDTPRGSILLSGARAITMRGDEIIEDADILVTDDRIVAIGPRGTVPAPADAVVRDLAGKTIVPGFIDIHDHIADIRRDVLAMGSWGLRARLAAGITTAFDPSSLSIDMFAYQDMIDAGLAVGSRVRTTGMAMFSFNRVASLDEARTLLRRYRDHYRTRNAKQYMTGNRRVRQWIAIAAAELGMMPTTEGAQGAKLDLSHIIDGFAGSEHCLPMRLHRDFVELLARSGTSYDTTLQIENCGPAAQDYFMARDRPHENDKFRHFRPHYVADQTALRGSWTDPVTFFFPQVGGDAAKVQRAGGVVGMGSHGEVPGPGFHWELEAHVMGGMTPHEALRAGTIGSATAIGRGAEFGSLEPGKFADLVILDRNPIDDIRNTRSTAQVMKNGRLYDAATLDELYPRHRKAPPAWFEAKVKSPE